MLKKRFHEIWAIPFLVLLFCTFQTTAQCPRTKSATFPMVTKGLPSLDRLELIDFLVNPADISKYKEVELSQNHFLCFDVGVKEIKITGLDSLDQPFSCHEFLWVYDSVFLCSNRIKTPKAIGGKIVTENNQPLTGITIGLSSNNINYFRASNEDGMFLFEDFETLDYRLTPTKTDGIKNGISTIDILLLQKHILGLRFLKSPYKIIAADLNNSGNVTAYDMVLLRQIILSIIDEFPNTPSWRFVDANHVFSNKRNPFADDFSYFSDLKKEDAAPQLSNHFIAIKVGDFNNSANISNESDDRAIEKKHTFVFTANNQVMEFGELASFAIKPTKDMLIEGLQFGLQYDEDKLEFVGIESSFEVTESNYFIKNDKINFSWTSVEGINMEAASSPFQFLFRAKEKTTLREAIQLDQQQLEAEIYTIDEVIIPFDFSWKQDPLSSDFQVFNNYPNPFSTSTTIAFYLPQTSKAQLSVFDTRGKRVLTKKQTFTKGENVFEIDEPFTTSGIYFYQIESDFGVANGKMNFLLR